MPRALFGARPRRELPAGEAGLGWLGPSPARPPQAVADGQWRQSGLACSTSGHRPKTLPDAVRQYYLRAASPGRQGASTGALSVRALPGFRPASRVLGQAEQAGRLPAATGRLRGSWPLSPLHSSSTIEPPPRTQWSTLACACDSLRRAAPCKLPGMQLRGVCGEVKVQLGGNPKRRCASFPLAAPSAS